MRKNVLLAILAFIILAACAFPASLMSPTTVPVAVDVPTVVLAATDTPIPTATSAPTDTPVPTVPPTVTPTLIILPQQWNGVYRQAGVGSIPISIIIEKMRGDSFTGKMIWVGTGKYRGATTVMSGEFVKDFGDATEQAKWGEHPDYSDGDRSGTWLKWTETGFVQGRGYTLGGWYYGHIGENGTMVGIYFLNEEITSFASSDTWELNLK